MPAQARCKYRRLFRTPYIEKLEERRLLTIDWRNPFDNLDVNADDFVSPIDALLVINDLNGNGPRYLPAVRDDGEPFVDTNGDQFVSPIDALLVINALNFGIEEVNRLTETKPLITEKIFEVEIPNAQHSLIQVPLDIQWYDTNPSSTGNDLLNVFLVSPSDRSLALVSTELVGDALFSIQPESTRLAAGRTTWDGTKLTLDVSAIETERMVGHLVFQLLNGDGEIGSLVNIGQPKLLSRAERPLSPLPQTHQTFGLHSEALDTSSLRLDERVLVSQSGSAFNPSSGVQEVVWHVEAKAATSRRIALVFDDLPNSVTILNASGSTDDGLPYISMFDVIRSGGLGAGDISDGFLVKFSNPECLVFHTSPKPMSGGLNSAPILGPPATIVVPPGRVTEIEVDVNDLDGDEVLLHGNIEDPSFDIQLLQNGIIRVQPTPDHVGTHTLELIASDGLEQTSASFNILVPPPDARTTVHGTVVGPTGVPASSIAVALGDRQVSTNIDGTFEFEIAAEDLPTMRLHIAAGALHGGDRFSGVSLSVASLLAKEVAIGYENHFASPVWLPHHDLATQSTVDLRANSQVEFAGFHGSLEIKSGNINLTDGMSIDEPRGVFATELHFDALPTKLPEGREPGFIVNLDLEGFEFTAPMKLELPNRIAAASNSTVTLFGLTSDTSRFVPIASGTVGADGLSITTRNGGIFSDGIYFFDFASSSSNFSSSVQSRNSSSAVATPGSRLFAEPRLVRLAREDCKDEWSVDSDGNFTHVIPLPGSFGYLLEPSYVHNPYATLAYMQFPGVVPAIDGVTNLPDTFFDHLGTVSFKSLVNGVTVTKNFGSHYSDSIPLQFSTNAIFDLSLFPTGKVEYVVDQYVEAFTDDKYLFHVADQREGTFWFVQTDPNAVANGWTLDSEPRLYQAPDNTVLIQQPDGNQLEFTRESDDSTNYVSPPGLGQTLVNDGEGFVWTIQPIGRQTKFNIYGRVVEHKDRNGNQVALEYDSEGRLLTILDPLIGRSNVEYDGLETTFIDPSGRRTTIRRDTSGNLRSVLFPDESELQYAYSSRNELREFVDRNGETRKLVYNRYGAITEEVYGDGSRIIIQPGLWGGLQDANSIIRQDRNGNATVKSEDHANRITTIRDEFGNLNYVQRDQHNRIISRRDQRGNNWQYEYDESGNLVEIREQFIAPAPNLLEQASSSAFVQEPIQGRDGALQGRIVMGDFNGNGFAEYAVAGYNSITVFDAASRAIIQIPEFDSQAAFAGLLAVDFNHDGIDDLLAADRNNKSVWFYQARGDGTFVPPVSLHVAFGAATVKEIVAGDFDGDGNMDILAINDRGLAEGNSVVAMYGDGTGGIRTRSSFNVTVKGLDLTEILVTPHLVNSTDINADGRSDLVLVGEGNIGTHFGQIAREFEVVILLGQADQSFTVASRAFYNVGVTNSLSAPFTALRDSTLADINRDGISELILYSGTNTLSFSIDTTEEIPSVVFFDNLFYDDTPPGGGQNITSGDIDSDGYTDLVVVGANDLFGFGGFGISRGGPNPAFSDLNDRFEPNDILWFPPPTPEDPFPPPPSVISTLPTDMNGDGVLDLLSLSFDGRDRYWFTPWYNDDVTVSVAKQFEYESAFGQITAQTDELDRRVEYEVDPNNGNRLTERRVVGAVDSVVNGETDDLVTKYTYTSRGLIETMTDALGRVTEYTYNARGLVTSITSAKGLAEETVRRFEYDATGNETAVIDGNGNRTEYEYDKMDRLTLVREADPDGDGSLESPVTSFAYDANGNLIGTVDAEESLTTNRHDELNRHLSTTNALGHTTSYDYDPNGNVTSVTDPLGLVSRSRYDGRNRLIEAIDPEGGRISYTYDLSNNLTSLTDPLGNVTVFVYDGRERLFRETDPLGNSIEYLYDLVDNLTQKVDRNGRITQFEYDDLDRIVEERWLESDGTTIANTINYAYDKVGNLLEVKDNYSHLTYTYDNLDQVKTVDNAGIPGAPKVALEYSYDANGNVLSVLGSVSKRLSRVF